MSSKHIKVLMIDDEVKVLFGLRRLLRHFCDLATAESGGEGLRLMDERGPFHVVFTDMRMPEMDGVEFLQAAQRKHPDTVYVMLTGNADQKTAIDAINKGQIFRFINKPCPADALEHLIVEAGRRYEVQRAEKALFRETLQGSVRLLIDTIMISHPALGRASELIAKDVDVMRETLGLVPDWRLPLAASLSLLGCSVSLSEDEVGQLSDEQLATGAEVGARLLRRIPRLEEVAETVGRQRESGGMSEAYAANRASARVETGARLLRFVVDLHRETEACGGKRDMALRQLERRRGEYDQRLIRAAKGAMDRMTRQYESKACRVRVRVPLRRLDPGMQLAEDVDTEEGKLLLREGQVLTAVTVERLRYSCKLNVRGNEVVVLLDEAEVGDLPRCA